jgi:hypothetical protein
MYLQESTFANDIEENGSWNEMCASSKSRDDIADVTERLKKRDKASNHP